MTLEEKYSRVRKALECLVGASSIEELNQMKATLRQFELDADGFIALAAIDTLLDTHPDTENA